MHKKYGVVIGLLVLLAFGFALRTMQLEADLPYQQLGSAGAFVLDEGAYQMSAAHKALFGAWQVPGAIYAGWTVRGYQLWVYAFFKMLGVNLFAARFACVVAAMLGMGCLLFFLRRYCSTRVLLLFAAFAMTNYLFIMWSRIALPYSVALLPAAGLCICTLLACWRKSAWFACAAGVCMFLLFTVKETAILFFPVALGTLVIGAYQQRAGFWRSLWNARTLAYVGTFALLMLAYQQWYLAPAAHEYWNDSSRQAQSMIQNTVEGVVAPTLQSSSKRYTMLTAVTKLFGKFFGMEHIYFTWILAFCGLLYVVAARNPPLLCKEGLGEVDNRNSSLVTIYMFLWATIVPLGLIVLRYRSGLSVHWMPLYLVPVFYFAALGVDGLWRSVRWQTMARAVAVALLLCAVGSDLRKVTTWIAHAPAEGAFHRVAREIAESVAREGDAANLLMVDATFLYLHQPKVTPLYMRAFEATYFPEMYQRWQPGYVTLLEPKAGPVESLAFRKQIGVDGFSAERLMSVDLGPVDGGESVVSLYRLGKRSK